MNPILSSAIGSLLRYALIYLAAFLVKHGIWTDSEAGRYIEGAVVALLTLGWSLWTHYRTRIKFLTALMPSNQTEQDVKDHLASGWPTPKVTTPAYAVPVPVPKILSILLILSFAFIGCARFKTIQTDTSYEQGIKARTITTKASSTTFFDSKSALTAFKASQTDKSQSASVGTLNQEASGTNAVDLVSRVSAAVVGAAISAAK